MSASHWLIYALGGGMGHLTRSIALARAAAAVVSPLSPGEGGERGNQPVVSPLPPGEGRVRGNQHATILSNSPFASAIAESVRTLAGCELELLAPSSTARDSAARVNELLRRRAYGVLVVDTFPRGVGGELAEIVANFRGRKVLVHRDINPEYAAQVRAGVDDYDLLLLPGEDAPFGGFARAVRTPPWLLCGREELLDFGTARKALVAQASCLQRRARVVVVAGCGRGAEAAAGAHLAARLAAELRDAACVRFTAPGEWNTLWPLLKYMPGIDILVGAGGYNTVHEARATRTPLVAFARERLYDRQARRLRPDERVDSDNQAIERVRGILARLPPGPREVPDYVNGAQEAALRIRKSCLGA